MSKIKNDQLIKFIKDFIKSKERNLLLVDADELYSRAKKLIDKNAKP